MRDLCAQGLDEGLARQMAADMADTPAALVLPQAMRPLIDLVIAVMGQWRMGGGGMAPLRPVALDLVAVDAAARWIGIPPTAALLRDLRVIEHEALALMRSEP